MRDNKNRQSIDEFYRNKIKNGKLDFDSNGWEALNARIEKDAVNSSVISGLIANWKSKWIPIISILMVAAISVCVYVYFDDIRSSHSNVSSLSETDEINNTNQNTFSASSKLQPQNELNENNESDFQRPKDINVGSENTESQNFGASKQENSSHSVSLNEEYPASSTTTGKTTKKGNKHNIDASKLAYKFQEGDLSSDTENSISKTLSDELNTIPNLKKNNNPSNAYSEINSIDDPTTASSKNNIPSQSGIEKSNLANEYIENIDGNITNENHSLPVVNDLEVSSKTNATENIASRESLKFSSIPLIEAGVVSDSSEVFIVAPPIGEVKVQQRNFKKFYVRAGYVESINDDFNNSSPRLMTGIGYTSLRKQKTSYGHELIYERFRNTRKTAVFIEDLNISSNRNRDAISIINTASWRPFTERFHTTIFAGFGLEYLSWDLESTQFFPFSSVEAARNSNKINMKPSPFGSMGGDIGFDLIKNSLSLHLSVNYQIGLKDPVVNGTLQGYKINATENEEAYSIIEDRILQKENFTSIYFSIKYYIF